MARRKKRNGGRKSKKIPVAATAGAILGTYNLVNGVMKSTPENRGAHVVKTLVGYDPNAKAWDFSDAFGFYGPIAGGAIASALASKFGINRRLSQIPFLKI